MRSINAIFTLLFGLAFAGGGLYFLGQTTVPMVQDWVAMQQWQSASGIVLNVERPDNGVEAEYEYQVDQTTYRGKRVYVAQFSDNIGRYQEQLQHRLESSQSAQNSITVWFDPANPSQSVIDRDMRWGLLVFVTIFCSVFILIGSVVAYAGLRSTRKNPQPSLRQLKQQWQHHSAETGSSMEFKEFVQQRRDLVSDNNPHTSANDHQYWQHKKEWRNNEIRSNANTQMIAMWVFAGLWNALTLPLIFVLPQELAKSNYGALAGLLFPLAGIFLTVKAVNLTREWKRFGVIKLVMDPFPGSIGGHVGGHLYIENLHQLDAIYKVELECVHSYVSGSGDNRRRRETIKWAEAGTAGVSPQSNGIRLSFRFDVPDNLPEADVTRSEAYNFWRLNLRANLPGVDLKRQYNIPVFKTGKVSSTVFHDLSAQMQQKREDQAQQIEAAINRGDLDDTALAPVLRYINNGDQHEFYFPMFRGKILTLFAFVFAAGFGFATYSINTQFGDGAFSIFTGVFSIPFAIVALIATIALIYVPLNNLRTRIRPGEIAVSRRLFIVPIGKHHIRSDELKELELYRSGSTGQGVKKIEHFNIRAVKHDNNKITIAESINGRDLAEQLKHYMDMRIKGAA